MHALDVAHDILLVFANIALSCCFTSLGQIMVTTIMITSNGYCYRWFSFCFVLLVASLWFLPFRCLNRHVIWFRVPKTNQCLCKYVASWLSIVLQSLQYSFSSCSWTSWNEYPSGKSEGEFSLLQVVMHSLLLWWPFCLLFLKLTFLSKDSFCCYCLRMQFYTIVIVEQIAR